MEQVNPLSNHVILENIFKSLDTPDLKAVRLVSPLWREASLDAWRKTAVLVLTPDDEGGGVAQLTLPEFKEMTRNEDGGDQHAHLKLGRKPFSNYKLVGWNFDSEAEEEQVEFLREHGPLTKYLHLDHCDFTSFSVFEDLLTRSLPNLQKLVWSVKRTPPEDDDGDVDDDDFFENGIEVVEQGGFFRRLQERHESRDNFQRSCKVLEICGLSVKRFEWRTDYWTRLFYCMPAVEVVTLRMQKSDWIETRTVFMSPLFLGLKLVTRLHQGSKIRKLDIMDFFTDASHVFGMGVYSLPLAETILDLSLEELSIDCGTARYSRLYKKVLHNSTDTLQVLKVFRAPKDFPNSLLAMPGIMDSLRELYLSGNVVDNLAFLRFTPSLKVLVMNQFCFDQRHKLQEIILQEPKQLRFCRTDLISNTEDELTQHKITQASVTVSSLEYLEVDYPVDAADVPTLAKWLPNVKTLKMVMNNELLAESCKAWPKLEEIECLYRSEVDDAGVSCLANCSELRKFKVNALCSHATLTSASVDQFLKISSLRQLDICTYNQVSQEAEAKLLDKLTEVNLIMNDHVSLGYECCEQKQFLQKVIRQMKPPSRIGKSFEDPVLVGPLGARALRVTSSVQQQSDEQEK